MAINAFFPRVMVIGAPPCPSPKQGGRDASSLGNLCIQREGQGHFYCLMAITWHLCKALSTNGVTIAAGSHRGKTLWWPLGVQLSGFQKHKILRPGSVLECCSKVPMECEQQWLSLTELSLHKPEARLPFSPRFFDFSNLLKEICQKTGDPKLAKASKPFTSECCAKSSKEETPVRKSFGLKHTIHLGFAGGCYSVAHTKGFW